MRRRIALLVLALLAGAALHGHPVGLGATVVTLAVLALSARERWGWWALAGGFALVPFLRDAGWVQAIGIGGAVLFAMPAAAGFATIASAVRAAGRGLLALVPGPFVVVAPLLQRTRGSWGSAVPAARGVALALLLLLPFGVLFGTADAAFAEWMESAGEAVPDFDENLPARLLIAAAVLAFAGALMAARPPRAGALGPPVVGRTEWLIALVALNGLFAAFVAVQLTTLFKGHEYVMRTAGLTYSEYLHQGFWQLIAAAALTLAVVSAARRWTVRSAGADDRLQRLLLGGLCLLTLIVLASAWQRLELYVEAYGMTILRVLVEWVLLFLAGLFVIVLVAHRAPWLPRAAVGFAGAALLLLALSNPEGRIASHNVGNGHRDRAVLLELSDDAAPARRCRTGERDGSLAGFNVARHRARGLVRCR